MHQKAWALPRKYRLQLRVLSALLAVSFCFQEISQGAPVILQGQEVRPRQSLAGLLGDPARFQTPVEHCALQEIHKGQSVDGKNPPLIIHIQDAHANLSGQQNLAGALENIIQNYYVDAGSSEPLLVLSEGGQGDCSLTYLKQEASAKIWQRVAKSFLMQGKLAGEEYLNLSSDLPMKIVGIEDMALYMDSLKTYAALAKNREKILVYLARIQKAVEKLKNQIYPKELVQYEELKLAKDARQDALQRSLEALLEVAQNKGVIVSEFENFSRLAKLMDREKEISFESANLEQAALLEAIEKKTGQGELKEVLSRFNQARRQRLSILGLLDKTFSIAQDNGIDLESYPNLSRYRAYLKDFSNLDLEKVLEEFKGAEDKIYVALLPESDARLIRSIDRHLELLETAYRIRMSSKDFEMFKINEPDFSTVATQAFINRLLVEQGYFEDVIALENTLEEGREHLETFYGLVGKRDDAFIQNTKEALSENKQSAAVLISGGYHTQHLKALFKEMNFSYLVLTPIVTQETNQAKYEKVLLEPLESQAKTLRTVQGESRSDKSLSALEKDLILSREKSDGLRALLTTNNGSRLGELKEAAGVKGGGSQMAEGGRLAEGKPAAGSPEKAAQTDQEDRAKRIENALSMTEQRLREISKQLLSPKTERIILENIAIELTTIPKSLKGYLQSENLGPEMDRITSLLQRAEGLLDLAGSVLANASSAPTNVGVRLAGAIEVKGGSRMGEGAAEESRESRNPFYKVNVRAASAGDASDDEIQWVRNRLEKLSNLIPIEHAQLLREIHIKPMSGDVVGQHDGLRGGIIFIDMFRQDDNEFNFTLVHEIGHAVDHLDTNARKIWQTHIKTPGVAEFLRKDMRLYLYWAIGAGSLAGAGLISAVVGHWMPILSILSGIMAASFFSWVGLKKLSWWVYARLTEGFVSRYAQTNTAEDFAEAYAHFVFNREKFLQAAKENPPMRSRYQAMQEIFGEELEDFSDGTFARGAEIRGARMAVSEDAVKGIMDLVGDFTEEEKDIFRQYQGDVAEKLAGFYFLAHQASNLRIHDKKYRRYAEVLEKIDEKMEESVFAGQAVPLLAKILAKYYFESDQTTNVPSGYQRQLGALEESQGMALVVGPGLEEGRDILRHMARQPEKFSGKNVRLLDRNPFITAFLNEYAEMAGVKGGVVVVEGDVLDLESQGPTSESFDTIVMTQVLHEIGRTQDGVREEKSNQEEKIDLVDPVAKNARTQLYEALLLRLSMGGNIYLQEMTTDVERVIDPLKSELWAWAARDNLEILARYILGKDGQTVGLHVKLTKKEKLAGEGEDLGARVAVSDLSRTHRVINYQAPSRDFRIKYDPIYNRTLIERSEGYQEWALEQENCVLIRGYTGETDKPRSGRNSGKTWWGVAPLEVGGKSVIDQIVKALQEGNLSDPLVNRYLSHGIQRYMAAQRGQAQKGQTQRGQIWVTTLHDLAKDNPVTWIHRDKLGDYVFNFTEINMPLNGVHSATLEMKPGIDMDLNRFMAEEPPSEQIFPEDFDFFGWRITRHVTKALQTLPEERVKDAEHGVVIVLSEDMKSISRVMVGSPLDWLRYDSATNEMVLPGDEQHPEIRFSRQEVDQMFRLTVHVDKFGHRWKVRGIRGRPVNDRRLRDHLMVRRGDLVQAEQKASEVPTREDLFSDPEVGLIRGPSGAWGKDEEGHVYQVIEDSSGEFLYLMRGVALPEALEALKGNEARQDGRIRGREYYGITDPNVKPAYVMNSDGDAFRVATQAHLINMAADLNGYANSGQALEMYRRAHGKEAQDDRLAVEAFPDAKGAVLVYRVPKKTVLAGQPEAKVWYSERVADIPAQAELFAVLSQADPERLSFFTKKPSGENTEPAQGGRMAGSEAGGPSTTLRASGRRKVDERYSVSVGSETELKRLIAEALGLAPWQKNVGGPEEAKYTPIPTEIFVKEAKNGGAIYRPIVSTSQTGGVSIPGSKNFSGEISVYRARNNQRIVTIDPDALADKTISNPSRPKEARKEGRPNAVRPDNEPVSRFESVMEVWNFLQHRLDARAVKAGESPLAPSTINAFQRSLEFQNYEIHYGGEIIYLRYTKSVDAPSPPYMMPMGRLELLQLNQEGKLVPQEGSATLEYNMDNRGNSSESKKDPNFDRLTRWLQGISKAGARLAGDESDGGGQRADAVLADGRNRARFLWDRLTPKGEDAEAYQRKERFLVELVGQDAFDVAIENINLRGEDRNTPGQRVDTFIKAIKGIPDPNPPSRVLVSSEVDTFKSAFNALANETALTKETLLESFENDPVAFLFALDAYSKKLPALSEFETNMRFRSWAERLTAESLRNGFVKDASSVIQLFLYPSDYLKQMNQLHDQAQITQAVSNFHENPKELVELLVHSSILSPQPRATEQGSRMAVDGAGGSLEVNLSGEVKYIASSRNGLRFVFVLGENRLNIYDNGHLVNEDSMEVVDAANQFRQDILSAENRSALGDIQDSLRKDPNALEALKQKPTSGLEPLRKQRTRSDQSQIGITPFQVSLDDPKMKMIVMSSSPIIPEAENSKLVLAPKLVPPNKTATIIQGEFVIAGYAEEGIEALQTYGLGPCVAVALWDKKAKIGALVHLDAYVDVRKSLEKIFQDLKSHGAETSKLRTAVVGGNEETSSLMILQIENFLEDHGAQIVHRDLRREHTQSLTLDLNDGEFYTVENPRLKYVPSSRTNRQIQRILQLVENDEKGVSNELIIAERIPTMTDAAALRESGARFAQNGTTESSISQSLPPSAFRPQPPRLAAVNGVILNPALETTTAEITSDPETLIRLAMLVLKNPKTLKERLAAFYARKLGANVIVSVVERSELVDGNMVKNTYLQFYKKEGLLYVATGNWLLDEVTLAEARQRLGQNTSMSMPDLSIPDLESLELAMEPDLDIPSLEHIELDENKKSLETVIKLAQKILQEPEKYGYLGKDILVRFTGVPADRRVGYQEMINLLQTLLGGKVWVQFGNMTERGFVMEADPSALGDAVPEAAAVIYAGDLSGDLLKGAQGHGVLLMPSLSDGTQASSPLLFQGLVFAAFVQRLEGQVPVEILQQMWRQIRAQASVDLTPENYQRLKDVSPQAALSDYLGLTLKLVAIEWEAFLDSVRTAVTQTGSAA